MSIGIRKALTLSFAQSWISLLLSAASIIIVSRLLTPAEVGVFSVAAGLVALVHMLRDFGVSEFIVQDAALDDDRVRTAFTINLVIAWVLAALLFACSGLVGDFYGNAGAARVTRVLSLVFALLPFGTTQVAMLRRNMRYDTLLKIRIGESTARSATAIGLAFAGFSYMSMAWAGVAGMAALVVGCAILGRQYRVRGLGLKSWRQVVHFGTNRTLSDVVGQAGAQAANIVVGKMLGMAAAGLYSRGYGVVNMFQTSVVGAVGNVAFPAFAKEHRETDSAAGLYLKSVVYLSGVCWPFFAFAAIMAFPMIRIAFGDRWLPAVPLMQWLCVAALVRVVTLQSGTFLTAIGRYRDVTRIEVTFQLTRIGLCIGAAFYGLVAVAAVQVLVYALAAVLYYRWLARLQPLRIKRLLRALAPSAGVTLASCVVPLAVLMAWPGTIQQHYLSAFVVASTGGALGWYGGLLATGHPLAGEIRRGVAMLRERASRVPPT